MHSCTGPTPAALARIAVKASLGASLVAGLAASCQPSEGSVALQFPSEEARRATVRLLIEVYDPDMGLATGGGRSCAELLGRAAAGLPRPGVPERSVYECEPGLDGTCPLGWFESAPALEIPRGRRAVYVLGYAETEPEATPFLEGCTDEFDTDAGRVDRVPVPLNIVLPARSRLVLASTNRLTGLAGARPEAELRVAVEADDPVFQRTTYRIPGVPVLFTPSSGIRWAETGAATPWLLHTGPDGSVGVRVVLGDAPGAGSVEASSEAIRAASSTSERSSLTFVVSVVGSPSFESARIRVEDVGRPVAMAFGSLAPGEPASLVLVGCDSPNPAGCAPGRAASGPLGAARLAVLEDLKESPIVVEVDESEGLGVLPADVVVAPIRSPGSPTIALLGGRRAGCQARRCEAPETCPCWTTEPGTLCPCEASEVRFLEKRGGRIVPVGLLALTASNAVALTSYGTTRQTAGSERLAIVGQGRSRNDRPCATRVICANYAQDACRARPETCGCPPNEACACPGCSEDTGVGVCVARDRIVDMVGLDPDDPSRVRNHLGCRVPDLFCNPESLDDGQGRCGCRDADRTGIQCSVSEVDTCGCRVPPQVRIGSAGVSSLPLDVVSGNFMRLDVDALAIATDAGLQLFFQSTGTFRPESIPFVNAPIEGVARVSLDPEAEVGRTSKDDLAWIASGACTVGISFEEQCPVVRRVPGAAGCFGVLTSDGLQTLAESTDRGRRCRRFELPDRPVALCAGDLDGNGYEDVAVAVEGSPALRLFLGDGFGGVLDPPFSVDLPAGLPGRVLACADVDDDGVSEVAVADEAGNVTVLWSSR